MSLKEATPSQDWSRAELRRQIDALVSPDVPLARQHLDQLAAGVIAVDDPALGARLVLAVHGRDALLAARRLAARLTGSFPNDAYLARVRDLVAPPRVVPTRPLARIDRRADFAWLKEHSAEYPEEWLVLSGGRLWGHSRSLPEAQEQAHEAGLPERPLLHYVSNL